uniref:Xylulose kinase-1 n=1 Tax=Tanacetum cinerariifolium TaxID=118510 RepID=A0A6L2JTV7_TANCI|nr:hypothetical protein [Tanacetum cinerariifolium]
MSSAFADTHNMVTILTKSDASEGFDQIIDFLNGSYSQYALIVNPHIYVSCIKQFWNTITVTQLTDITRLQALVDKKKVMISEAVIRDFLRLDDAERVDCLPNEEIFTGLAHMGYEKPSTKLTFYKAFFSSQWKFLIHTILQSLSAKRMSWNEFSSAMASAENVVGGIANEQVQDDVVVTTAPEDVTAAIEEDVQAPSIPSPPQDIPSISYVLSPPPQSQSPTPTQPQAADFLMNLEITKLKTRVKKLERANKVKPLKLRRLRKVGTFQRIKSSDDTVIEDVINQGWMIDELDRDEGVALMGEKEEEKKAEEIDMNHPSKVLSMHEEESTKVQEVVEVVTTAKLIITEVVTAASALVSVASTIIPAVEPNIPTVTITAAPVKVAAASTRRRKRSGYQGPEEESSAITPAETKDKGKGIMVEEPKPMKKKQQVEMDEAYARKLPEKLNQDIDCDVAMDHVKQKAKEDSFIQRYQEEANRALESISETLAQKAAKRKRLKEDKDVEEIKQHLEIVIDEDDDVYTEATPLARKVPVVDYHIIHLNNKPRYKIIRADQTHQLYVSFITLLKNFDREDLESLWSIVKERSLKKNTKCFNATGEELSAVKHKLMLLDTAAEERVNTAKWI